MPAEVQVRQRARRLSEVAQRIHAMTDELRAVRFVRDEQHVLSGLNPAEPCLLRSRIRFKRRTLSQALPIRVLAGCMRECSASEWAARSAAGRSSSAVMAVLSPSNVPDRGRGGWSRREDAG